MPTFRKPPITNLNELLKGLSEARIEFVIVGGVAAVVQGAPITTFDLDVVHRQTDENLRKLMTFLKSVGAIQRRPDEKTIKPIENDLRGRGHNLLTTCFGPLDLLGAIENNLGYDDLVPLTVEIAFKGHQVHVLKLESMVEMKREVVIPEEHYRLRIYEETLRMMRKKEGEK